MTSTHNSIQVICGMFKVTCSEMHQLEKRKFPTKLESCLQMNKINDLDACFDTSDYLILLLYTHC